jgi:hypothetical protein
VHEGGIRSPFFIRWPGRIVAGRQVDQIAAHVDVTPTLLAAAAVEQPDDLKFDGQNLLPLLEGDLALWPERSLVLQTHRGDVPVAEHQFAVVEQRWKLVRQSGFGREQPAADAPFELYDLTADPGEQNDVAGDYPDEVTRLRARYNEWFRDVSNTRSDNYAPPRIVIGTPHEIETTLTRQDWRSGDSQWDPAGWGEIGQWLVHAAEPAVFDATVILQSPMQGEAELRIGPTVVKQSVNQPQQEIEFRGVSAPAGNMAVTFRLLQEDEVRSAYQVVLRRQ